MNLNDKKIAIIGLGYVGLPLAIEFGKEFKTFGFDINNVRTKQLQNGFDITLEANLDDLKKVNDSAIGNGLFFTTDVEKIKDCNIYIVTVPTPIDQFKAPDLKPLLKATEMIARVFKKNDIVIYESTVYPGVQKTSVYLYWKNIQA